MSNQFVTRDTTRVTFVPFYGGGKGQSLQITENAKGEILSTVIVKTPDRPAAGSSQEQTEIEIDPQELEYPALPSKYETEHFEDEEEDGYDDHLRNIQKKAGEIVKLQEKGELSQQEEKRYKEYVSSINESAKKLSEAQEGAFENREGLNQWFERKREKSKDKNRKKETAAPDKNKAGEEEIKPPKEEAENEQENNESVAINLPPDDASVAEAKPVGLAVAGEGGVAASKPIATAVVGPAGLAIARPIATAIAGVSPEQALVPVYAEGLGAHKKNGKIKSDQMSEFLNRIISKYHQT